MTEIDAASWMENACGSEPLPGVLCLSGGRVLLVERALLRSHTRRESWYRVIIHGREGRVLRRGQQWFLEEDPSVLPPVGKRLQPVSLSSCRRIRLKMSREKS